MPNASDTLVVNDSGSVFSTFWDTNIQCCEVFTKGSWSCSGNCFMVKVGVLFFKVFNPPSIMGETEVTEGSPLHLYCDGSNSDPQPTLQWISPNGKTVNESAELDIVTTTRNMTGIYTCVATLPRSTATMISTVDIKIILPIDCPTLNSTDTMIVNMSSTEEGSTATYQCRDGPTDVYTTQCTSTGVWHPHPLSTLDCSKETVSCERLNSTDTVIVMMSSTAVGSTATYQCRDGPIDVYTTQCTSTGVWDPSPECTSKETGKWLPWGAGVVGLLLLCCVTNCAVITAVCVCRRRRKKREQYLLRENRNHSNKEQQMAVKNSQYLPVVKKTSEGTTATTTLNGRSFVIESQLTTPAEPNGKPSEPNGKPSEPQPTTTPPIPLGQYSMITTIPEPTSEVFWVIF
ncbi:Leucine-rich repeat and fibronectin type-III domain-containing protein 5 [Geodia barretti]|uniref:Leucine-rich repeat and fibronectin type-III domain-containing protein 5 n=1 Tax=Geodia barretti TaxID=519541 RepID=A0AA35WKG2_GEOBA|nr:Leucine-rich repeat and fibronectin type-III domain-containing protein 5 [Geodia barretti]